MTPAWSSWTWKVTRSSSWVAGWRWVRGCVGGAPGDRMRALERLGPIAQSSLKLVMIGEGGKKILQDVRQPFLIAKRTDGSGASGRAGQSHQVPQLSPRPCCLSQIPQFLSKIPKCQTSPRSLPPRLATDDARAAARVPGSPLIGPAGVTWPVCEPIGVAAREDALIDRSGNWALRLNLVVITNNLWAGAGETLG